MDLMSSVDPKRSAQRRSPCKKQIILDFQNLRDFPSIGKIGSATSLSLDRNPITSLANLPTIEYLEKLSLSHTEIESFQGAKAQPSLENLVMLNSPLGLEKFFPIMALIVYGSQLNIINNGKVSAEDRNFSDQVRPHLRDLLLDGWVITSKSPVRLLHRVTRERRVMHITITKSAASSRSPSRMSAHTPKKASGTASVTESPFVYNPTFDEVEEITDDVQLDNLLHTLIKLSKEWNRGPAADEVKTGENKDDDFYKSATMAAQSASMVRYRRALRTKEGPTEVPKGLNAIGASKSPPIGGRNKYPWLTKRVEEERKKKETKENIRKEQQLKAIEARKEKERHAAEAADDKEDTPTFSLLDQLYAKRFYRFTESSGRERLRVQDRSKTSSCFEVPATPGSPVRNNKPGTVQSPTQCERDMSKIHSQSVFHLIDDTEMLGHPMIEEV